MHALCVYLYMKLLPFFLPYSFTRLPIGVMMIINGEKYIDMLTVTMIKKIVQS